MRQHMAHALRSVFSYYLCDRFAQTRSGKRVRLYHLYFRSFNTEFFLLACRLLRKSEEFTSVNVFFISYVLQQFYG